MKGATLNHRRQPGKFPHWIEHPADFAGLLREGPFGLPEVDPSKLVVVYDLEDAVDAQLKDAEKLIKRTRKLRKARIGSKRTRRDPSTWLTYLRLLDARSSGCTFKEIGLAMNIASDDDYPEKRATNRTRDYVRRAERLTVNYLSLLPPPKTKTTLQKK